jgi:O-antigen/teichoic acid export membrane protein
MSLGASSIRDIDPVSEPAALETSTEFSDRKKRNVTSPLHFSVKKAYVYTFASTLAVRATGVISGLLAARILGPTGRGELAVIMSVAILVTTVGELEIPRSLAFAYSKDVGHSSPVTIATGFWLALLLGAVQLCIALPLLRHFLPADKLYLLAPSAWFLLYLPAFYLMTFLSGIDQGRGLFARFSAIQALPGVIYLACILVFWIRNTASAVAFAIAVLSGMFGAALVRVFVERNSIFRCMPDWNTARRLLGRGATFYLPAVAWLALSRADTFLLVRLVPTAAVGIYIVAQAVAFGQNGAMSPFIAVGFTAIASQQHSESALATLTKHFRIAVLVAASVGIATAAVAPWLIRIAFGARYESAATVTWFLIIATAFSSLSLVLDQGLRASGYSRVGIVSNVAGLLLLFGIGRVACLRFGILGLSCSLAAAQLTSIAILLGFCTIFLGIDIRQFFTFSGGIRAGIRIVRSALNRLSRNYRQIAGTRDQSVVPEIGH